MIRARRTMPGGFGGVHLLPTRGVGRSVELQPLFVLLWNWGRGVLGDIETGSVPLGNLNFK